MYRSGSNDRYQYFFFNVYNLLSNLSKHFYLASASCVMSLLSGLILGYLDKRANRILKKTGQAGEVIRFSDVKDFPATFWLMSVICVAYYVAIFPFIGLGQ